MNTKRITVSMPTHLYNQLIETVPERQVSKFVSESVEERLLALKRAPYGGAKDLLVLRDSLPRYSTEEIKNAINKGRT